MTGKTILYIRSICLLLLFASSLKMAAQKQTSAGTDLEIVFLHYAGSKILQLDSGLYKNDLSQDFSVTKFKYYIGNITLNTINGKAISFDDYYLIDEEKPNSKTLSLKNVPTGEYVSISFNIGVDSIDNCSGAQSGALDPINGMFWTWNTGYIFMKLEGISEFSSSPNATLEYHIGGFKEPNNCIRNVSLPLSNPYSIVPKNRRAIEIKTDVLELLKQPITIDFSKLSSVTDHNNATMMADNYKDMFSILISE